MPKKAVILDSLYSNAFDIHYKDSNFEERIIYTDEYHYHEFQEIYCLLDGEVDYYVEDRSYYMRPGNILLINHHDIHHVMPRNPEIRYERAFFYFDLEYLNKLSSPKTNLSYCFSKINNRASHFLPTTREQIWPYIQDILNFENTARYGDDILCNQRFNEFLIFINKITLEFQDKQLPPGSVKENEVVFHAIRYIQEHLSQPIKVNELAAAQYISREHLTREFKRHTGFSPHSYIQKRKLIYAKECLMDGATITTACSESGFLNYSHFINSFKKEFKMTPHQFQKCYFDKNIILK